MSERRSVLIVDDEPDLLELLEVNLARAGFQTATARNGREALSMVEESPPDLVLLDIMMPELSGTEVASRLRAKPTTASIPIIMLTAKGEEVDEIVGLTVGADDYVTKPFSTKVLLARIEAVLRRAQSDEGPTSDGLTRLGPISINEETHEAWCDGEALKLTLTEFRLLAALVDAGGKVLSRAALMSKAMGPGVTVTERTIDVHVTSIRKKLGEHAGVIHTVRGVGYKATPPAHADAELQ